MSQADSQETHACSESQQHKHKRRGGSHAPAMPANELRGPISARPPPGPHGKPFQVKVEVFGELLNRDVAFARLLAYGLEDNRIEIAADLRGQVQIRRLGNDNAWRAGFRFANGAFER